MFGISRNWWDYCEGNGMIIIKVALLTCAFYMGFAILFQAGLFLALRWAESVFVGGKLLVATSAVMWAISFGMAWYIVSANFRAKFPH
jgi:hypothetical protein